MDIPQILNRKFPNNEWTLNGDDYEGLTWLSENPKPSKKELEDLWSTVEQEILNEKSNKATQRQALLARLGITEEEARILLGGN